MRKIKGRETNLLVLNAKDQILIERTKTYLQAISKGEKLTYQELKIAKKGWKIAKKILNYGKTWKKTFVNYNIDDFIKACEQINLEQLS